MRFLIREKLLALGDDFTIKDETGRDVLFVDGKVFKLRDTLDIKDMEGRVLLTVRRKWISMRPSYEIWRDGVQIATVSRSFIKLLRDKFTVDVPGPDDIAVQGDFLSHEYSFSRQGKLVARVSKHWFSITDAYGVEVAEGEDDLLILASAIVIDRISFENEDHERDLGLHR